MGLDQLLERNAHGLFDVAGPVHVAGDAEYLCAVVLGTTDARKPRSAASQDRGDHRDGLDVVDRGGATIEADRRGEWRLVSGHPLFCLSALQQCRLFAADICPRPAMEID